MKNLVLIVLLESKVLSDTDSGKDEQKSAAVTIDFSSGSD